METISLLKSTDRLTLRDGQLVQWDRENLRDSYPIRCTETVEVYGNAQITTQAVKECLKEGIRINYFNVYGKFLGRAEPEYPKNIRRRMEQYRLHLETERRLQWAKALIAAKIQGEIVEIRRLREQGFSLPAQEIRKVLKQHLVGLPVVPNLKSLLGTEGICTKTYYRIFASTLPAGVAWNGRSYHPPADRLNAVLSLIYSVTAQEIRSLLEKHSLDPHCGFLHEPGYGGGGLASDLLEAVRATFCDHLALRLIHREPAVREFVKGPPSPAYLPDPLMQNIRNQTRSAMHNRFRLQKMSPADQLDDLVTRLIDGLNDRGRIPEFSRIHPER